MKEPSRSSFQWPRVAGAPALVLLAFVMASTRGARAQYASMGSYSPMSSAQPTGISGGASAATGSPFGSAQSTAQVGTAGVRNSTFSSTNVGSGGLGGSTFGTSGTPQTGGLLGLTASPFGPVPGTTGGVVSGGRPGLAGVAGASANLQLAFPLRQAQRPPDFFGTGPGKAKPGEVTKPGEAQRAAPAGSAPRSASELQRQHLLLELDGLVGVPYRYGGRNPGDGLDSAGLVWQAFKSVHRQVPDDPEDQERMGTRLPADQFVERGRFREDAHLRPGDVLFFRVGLPQLGMTGVRPVLYAGGGRAVFSSPSRGHVVSEDIRDKARALAFVQRVLLP